MNAKPLVLFFQKTTGLAITSDSTKTLYFFIMQKCLLLANEINEIFKEGINLSSGVVDFIDSTFSIPSIAELEEIVNDRDNGDSDCLLELILFPDILIQTRLEWIIEENVFEKKDEVEVVNYIASQQNEIRVSFPDERSVFGFIPPPWALGQFILRLNICKIIDGRFIRAINNSVTEKTDRDTAKVKLRNARFNHTKEKSLFLCAFFEKMTSVSVDFFDSLDYAIELFGEPKEPMDIYLTFMEKKRSFLQLIERAEKLEEQMRKNNIETLMLQRVTMPCINKMDLYKKIQLINTICLHIYGKTEDFGQARVDLTMDSETTYGDMGKIINSLS